MGGSWEEKKNHTSGIRPQGIHQKEKNCAMPARTRFKNHGGTEKGKVKGKRATWKVEKKRDEYIKKKKGERGSHPPGTTTIIRAKEEQKEQGVLRL